jgi:hypothetical protein
MMPKADSVGWKPSVPATMQQKNLSCSQKIRVKNGQTADKHIISAWDGLKTTLSNRKNYG